MSQSPSRLRRRTAAVASAAGGLTVAALLAVPTAQAAAPAAPDERGRPTAKIPTAVGKG